MKNATEALTVFYSGRDHESNSITFNDGVLQKSTIADVISKHNNPNLRVIFITDSLSGGSFFNINGSSNTITFWVKKTSDIDYKDAERTHGISTYYFCKIIGDCQNICLTIISNLEAMIIPQSKRSNHFFENDFFYD